MFKFSSFLLVLLAVTVVAGCGGKDKADAKAKTQVAAKVNGSEITVHQINFALQRLGPQNEAQAKEASKQVLRILVEQEMLYQKALEAKLDRDPQVVQALEFSRRQYLAQAYLARQVKPVKPGDADIKAYYKQHPELFEQRRVFNLQEITAQMKPEQQAELQKVLEKPISMEQIAQWLKSRNIQFTGTNSARAAEQMPPEYLKRIAQLQNGQIGTLRSSNSVMLVRMLGSQPQAVNETQAKPAIEQLLAKQKNIELASAEMKKVRDASKIVFLGDYVDLGKEPALAQAKTAVPAAVSESQSEKAVEKPIDKASVIPSPSVKATEKPIDKAMERGLSGLK
ncbi:MAG: peptidyl-prolyl cis-trans isomerase, EpsD family [Hydrogenophilales bacterium]|nr:peptidyl-prolyl cis-trans isomerase, EpsD family [Hydrogenophilales bacterium]